MNDNMATEEQAMRALNIAKAVREFCLVEDRPHVTEVKNIIELIAADIKSKSLHNVPRRLNLLLNIYTQIKNEEISVFMKALQNSRGYSEELQDDRQNMVNAIAEIIIAKGECLPSDLINKGFLAEDIKHCWAMAYGLAKVKIM